jgi:RNA binding exosome subunit
MPFANLTMRATSSGLEDENVIATALSWLIGDESAVEMERTKSWHGSPVYMFSVRLGSKGAIKRALRNMGPNLLKTLVLQLQQRMDEYNAIHFRLDLASLVSAQITLADPGAAAVVKARLKLRTFPGQVPHDVAVEALEELSERACIPSVLEEEE